MKKKIRSKVLTVLMIICAAGAAVSGIFLFIRLRNYGKSNDEYRQIEQQVAEELTENETEDIINIETAPIEIDWERLLAINSDVVGWIYIPCLDISYPIMQTDDNEYYLHRTTEGTYLYAGSIFADCSNSSDFGDLNTIIYGHNMADGSMFGTLWHITYCDAASDNPYFWIITPNISYKYKIFSSFETTASSEVYKFFEINDETFLTWIRRMKDMSNIDTGELPTGQKTNVVTLSTCSGTGKNGERTLVLGIKTEISNN